MPKRLRSWADWFHAYPMSPEMVVENINYTAANIRKEGLNLEQMKTEITLNRFQFKVRETQSAK